MESHIDGTRKFQFWEFQVSHGRALVRSPMSHVHSSNVDLMFFGVDYISIPRVLRNIKLVEPINKEVELCSSILGRKLSAEQLFVLETTHRHLIVAARLVVEKNKLDLFESPFESLTD